MVWKQTLNNSDNNNFLNQWHLDDDDDFDRDCTGLYC